MILYCFAHAVMDIKFLLQRKTICIYIVTFLEIICLVANFLVLKNPVICEMHCFSLSWTHCLPMKPIYNLFSQLELLKNELDSMKNDHNKQVVSINSELSRLQQVQDTEAAENQKQENLYNATKGGVRERVSFI